MAHERLLVPSKRIEVSPPVETKRAGIPVSKRGKHTKRPNRRSDLNVRCTREVKRPWEGTTEEKRRVFRLSSNRESSERVLLAPHHDVLYYNYTPSVWHVQQCRSSAALSFTSPMYRVLAHQPNYFAVAATRSVKLTTLHLALDVARHPAAIEVAEAHQKSCPKQISADLDATHPSCLPTISSSTKHLHSPPPASLPSPLEA